MYLTYLSNISELLLHLQVLSVATGRVAGRTKLCSKRTPSLQQHCMSPTTWSILTSNDRYFKTLLVALVSELSSQQAAFSPLITADITLQLVSVCNRLTFCKQKVFLSLVHLFLLKESLLISKSSETFCLVTYSNSRNSYRLVVHSAKSVPEFGPPLPSKGEFTDQQEFRDFLLQNVSLLHTETSWSVMSPLSAVINGEKAAYAIPTFTEKRVRTLEQLIKSSEQKYLSEVITSQNRSCGGWHAVLL